MAKLKPGGRKALSVPNGAKQWRKPLACDGDVNLPASHGFAPWANVGRHSVAGKPRKNLS